MGSGNIMEMQRLVGTGLGMRRLRPPLAAAALRASGVSFASGLERYLARFDELAWQIGRGLPSGEDAARARFLFDWLWQTKPRRYQPGGSFRLTEVLEAQLGAGHGPVGNCLGLTVLYNCLAQRFGLNECAVHVEHAFHGVPHVFTLLRAGTESVDVEHVLPNGFDYQGHRVGVEREEWGDRELLADIYLSRGNELLEARRWHEAITCYDAALRLNPTYEKAEINRAIAMGEMATPGA